MTHTAHFSALIYGEDGGYVAICPALDVASQGASLEESRSNLVEAIQLYLECADPREAEARARTEFYVTRIEVVVESGSNPSAVN